MSQRVSYRKTKRKSLLKCLVPKHFTKRIDYKHKSNPIKVTIYEDFSLYKRTPLNLFLWQKSILHYQIDPTKSQNHAAFTLFSAYLLNDFVHETGDIWKAKILYNELSQYLDFNEYKNISHQDYSIFGEYCYLCLHDVELCVKMFEKCTKMDPKNGEYWMKY